MQVAQNLLMTSLQSCIFGFETFHDITHTKARTARFLAVGGADSLAGCAYFVLAFGCFVSAVEHTVGRKDKMSAVADVKTAAQVVTGSLQLAGLIHKEIRGYHAPIANDIQFALIKDSRWNTAKNELLSFEDNRMSGIGAACETGYDIIARSEHIHDFSFAFVSKNYTEQGIYLSSVRLRCY